MSATAVFTIIMLVFTAWAICSVVGFSFKFPTKKEKTSHKSKEEKPKPPSASVKNDYVQKQHIKNTPISNVPTNTPSANAVVTQLFPAPDINKPLAFGDNKSSNNLKNNNQRDQSSKIPNDVQKMIDNIRKERGFRQESSLPRPAFLNNNKSMPPKFSAPELDDDPFEAMRRRRMQNLMSNLHDDEDTDNSLNDETNAPFEQKSEEALFEENVIGLPVAQNKISKKGLYWL